MNTYEDRQRRLADALMAKGMNPQPINGHYGRTNALADVLSSVMGAATHYAANQREKSRADSLQQTLSRALRGPENEQQEGFVGPPQDKTEYMIRELSSNPQTAQTALELRLAQMKGDGGAPAELRMFNELTRDMSDADRERARRVHLGLDPRPSSAAVPDELFGNPVDETDAAGQPVRVQYGNRGTRKVITGAKPAPKRGGGLIQNEDGSWSLAPGGKLTEGEGKSVTYGVRAAGAMKTLDELEDSGYDPSNAMDRFADKAWMGNSLKSPIAQKYGQAELEFLGAILRKDTGAAVTKEEIEIYGNMFFPRFGDSPEVRAQKRIARHRAYEGLKSGAGAAGGLIPNDAGAAPRGGPADDPLGLRQ